MTVTTESKHVGVSSCRCLGRFPHSRLGEPTAAKGVPTCGDLQMTASGDTGGFLSTESPFDPTRSGDVCFLVISFVTPVFSLASCQTQSAPFLEYSTMWLSLCFDYQAQRRVFKICKYMPACVWGAGERGGSRGEGIPQLHYLHQTFCDTAMKV